MSMPKNNDYFDNFGYNSIFLSNRFCMKWEGREGSKNVRMSGAKTAGGIGSSDWSDFMASVWHGPNDRYANRQAGNRCNNTRHNRYQ